MVDPALITCRSVYSDDWLVNGIQLAMSLTNHKCQPVLYSLPLFNLTFFNFPMFFFFILCPYSYISLNILINCFHLLFELFLVVFFLLLSFLSRNQNIYVQNIIYEFQKISYMTYRYTKISLIALVKSN